MTPCARPARIIPLLLPLDAAAWLSPLLHYRGLRARETIA